MLDLRCKEAVTAAAMLVSLCGLAHAEASAPKRYVDAGRIVFCSDLSYPPWSLIDPKTSKPAGIEIEMSDALAQLMGVSAEHKNIQLTA